ncbi:glycoside hydrolase [Nocardioides mangrovicus]|uniref:Glycoside hydrolase n=1 Tax=Nocardioides mangrovicus TaxID=2478913 RepID=A0A3L8P3C4_9ACTN|nr:glycoside hydrolase family 43 protein [Nocardioides mangrovicus]RLV49571.1 glycoside hydrolase [Nocardioides mangrovicus]
MPPHHRRQHRDSGPRRRTPVVLALLAVAAMLGSLLVGSSADAARPGAFDNGRAYSGDFPDPSVIRAGSTYYAYSTNTSNLNLPTLASKDLVHWTAYGDSMPSPGSWTRQIRSGGRSITRTWAPSVTYVHGQSHGQGRFVLAYTAPIDAGGARKNCIGLASAAKPTGPFVDHGSHPVVCPSDQGAIDPQVYVAEDGHPYLIWKTEGIVGHAPTVFWSQRLRADGTALADGTSPTSLLSTALAWEGHVIENPTMIRVNGLIYLFYSANEYRTTSYAIGYAVCQSVLGPCVRPSTAPLLATGGGIAGPGGPTPVLGPDGQLRLAYAAWDAGRVGYPRNQRRLHVARLAIDADGLLHVTDRG